MWNFLLVASGDGPAKTSYSWYVSKQAKKLYTQSGYIFTSHSYVLHEPAADVWSASIVILEMANGEVPNRNSSLKVHSAHE